MNQKEIEAEIQERVNFKMEQLLSAVKEASSRNWHLAFNSGNPKYQYYQEAFAQMSVMFRKEMEMPVPSDDMYGMKRRGLRDKAVDAIMKRLKINSRDRSNFQNESLERFLADKIGESQRLL